jgi:hypothetical protein
MRAEVAASKISFTYAKFTKIIVHYENHNASLMKTVTFQLCIPRKMKSFFINYTFANSLLSVASYFLFTRLPNMNGQALYFAIVLQQDTGYRSMLILLVKGLRECNLLKAGYKRDLVTAKAYNCIVCAVQH